MIELLSSMELTPGNITQSNVEKALADLKKLAGQKHFYKVASLTYKVLKSLGYGDTFDFCKAYKDDNTRKIIIASAMRFIIDNTDYEFYNDYSAVRRQFPLCTINEESKAVFFGKR